MRLKLEPMRALILAALVSACGAPAELDESGAEELKSDASEKVTTEELDDAEPAPPEAEYGEQLGPVPECLYFAPEALDRFPGLRDATHNAAARWWRWYPEGGPECSIHIIISGKSLKNPKALAHGWHSDTYSGVRFAPDAPIFDDTDDCSGSSLALIDALTHELGHAFGHAGHNDCEGCAMNAVHAACAPISPTDEEVSLVNGCGDWGPPDVADCPL